MISKFFNGGKVLLLAVALFATPVLAGSGGVSSNADIFPGLRALFPAYGSYTAAFQKGPQIFANKASYLAGESVEINGTDFAPYERVRFAAGTQAKDGNSAIVIGEWDVYADGKGRVSTSWDIPSSESYTVTATGMVSGLTGKIEINPEAEAVTITQCANSNATPQNLNCPETGNSGWVSGNVGSSKSRYFEGNSIAYRAIIDGLSPNTAYTYTIQYDVSDSGINTLDYLTTYNRTITGANPCKGATDAQVNAHCTFGAGTGDAQVAIPTDQRVVNGRDQINGNIDDITPAAGQFRIWGASSISVVNPGNPYTYSCSSGGAFPTGSCQASISLNFTTAAGITKVVLAWGGHISTRADWGETFGSVNRTGSPYHMRNGGLVTPGGTCCTGQQELQLSAAAVTPTGRITIIKQATPPSDFPFDFTATNLTPGTFTLVDDNDNGVPGDGTGGSNPSFNPSRVYPAIDTYGTKRITEVDPSPFTLQAINCTVDVNGSPQFPATTFTVNLASRFVDINIQPRGEVTCTFVNDFTTAVEAIVQGRVIAAGRPVAGAWVSATDGNGNTRFARTNVFGRYSIGELEAGTAIFVDVAHKSFTFPSRFVTLSNDVNQVDFNGTAR